MNCCLQSHASSLYGKVVGLRAKADVVVESFYVHSTCLMDHLQTSASPLIPAGDSEGAPHDHASSDKIGRSLESKPYSNHG